MHCSVFLGRGGIVRALCYGLACLRASSIMVVTLPEVVKKRDAALMVSLVLFDANVMLCLGTDLGAGWPARS